MTMWVIYCHITAKLYNRLETQFQISGIFFQMLGKTKKTPKNKKPRATEENRKGGHSLEIERSFIFIVVNVQYQLVCFLWPHVFVFIF